MRQATRIGSILQTIFLWVAASIAVAPAPAVAQSNPIVVENQQPGSPNWLWTKLADDVNQQIKGYASATSVGQNGSITFYVTVNPVQNYTIDFYRIGWYAGNGGRLRLSVGPLSGFQQATCPTDATTGMIACSWTPGYTLTVPGDWTSGVYYALLTNSQGYQNYVVFVVKDGRAAPFLYQHPVDTDEAYNDYPNDGVTGKSLYAYNSYGANTQSGNASGVEVSFDRPLCDAGLGQSVKWTLNTIRWLEQMGYDVTYSTNVDTHVSPGELLRHKAFLSAAHDEYWTKEMRDGVEAARDAGVNLAFLGGNSSYTQIRFEPSAAGAPNRVIVEYRNFPWAPTDPIQGPTTTTDFRQPPVSRPEQTLVGLMFSFSSPNVDYVVTNSNHWVYAGTGLHDGDHVAGIVGYEADAFLTNYPPPTTANQTLLSNSPYTDSGSGTTVYSNASIYQAPSGAWVFASGTMSWAWALDDSVGPLRNFKVDARIQRATANVLDRFLTPAGDFAVTASPSSQTAQAGASASYGVAITPSGSFGDAVSLSVTGLPSGAAGTFTPNPATTSSTLSVTTSTGTPIGTYTLTITGVSGALTHTATVTLAVTAPARADFTLDASPPSRRITPGTSTTFAATITPVNGFAGQVTFTVAGLPAGASGSFSPNPAASSSTLSVTTSTSTPIGTYPLTITGTSGSLTHTATATLAVTRVAFDNAVSTGLRWQPTTITTPSFVVGSGANRAAMIMVIMTENMAVGISASLGGASATLVPGTDTGTTAGVRTMIFCVANPPSGAQTATVSWTNVVNGADVGVITVSGADQATPCTNGTSLAGNSRPAPTSVTIASATGDLTASVGYTNDAWAAPYTNQTLKWGLDSGQGGGDIGPGTGTTTHTWTDQWPLNAHAVSGANFKGAP